MSRALPHYRDFRRYSAPAEVAQRLLPKTIPAPTRGLILNENPAFMQPAAALVLENWFVTENTIRLRGGSQTWASLPETTPVRSLFNYVTGFARKLFATNDTKLYEVTTATPAQVTGITLTNGHFSTAQFSNLGNNWLIAVNDTGDDPLRYNGTTWVQLNATSVAAWVNSTAYAAGALAKDPQLGTVWKVNAGQAHTSPAGPTTFAQDRNNNPGRWTSGAAADNAGYITGPVGSAIANGRGLTQVWKYRRRLFFIQAGTMDAWYLDIDSVSGSLLPIPLSGAFTLGGQLLFGCAWTVSAGDGIDDKCIFVTTEGEIAIFTGTDPSSINNWKQQGRYRISKPLGKNSWLNIGGDVLIITVDGIVPISQALVKDVAALEFSALTHVIHPIWEQEVKDKNDRPWSMCKWEEFGGLFVALPGGTIGSPGVNLGGGWTCLVANTVTGAWSRFTGWDAMQFCTLSGNMYFGTQDGRVVQADVTGHDHSAVRPLGADVEGSATCPWRAYTNVYVGGWEVFGSPPFLFTFRQARVAFQTRANELFLPYVTACTDYVVSIPPQPPAGPFYTPSETWDEGLWGLGNAGTIPPDPPPTTPPNEPGRARWDQPGMTDFPTRSTMWISIGETGKSHAPIVQVTVFQENKPDVEMLGISMLAEQAGVAV